MLKPRNRSHSAEAWRYPNSPFCGTNWFAPSSFALLSSRLHGCLVTVTTSSKLWHLRSAALAFAFCPVGHFQAQAVEGTAQTLGPASSQFIVGEYHTDLTKAAARARGAVWEAWSGGEARTVRVEFRPKDWRPLILDFHIVPHGRVLLTCAMPCSDWKLKQEQSTTVERRFTQDGKPIGENERLPANSFHIAFLDSESHLVFWL